MKRSKRRPPEGTRCDATTGVDYTRRTPAIQRCKSAATVELIGVPMIIGETWVCEEHATALEKKHAKEARDDR